MPSRRKLRNENLPNNSVATRGWVGIARDNGIPFIVQENGVGGYMCCPFHHEKTASCRVWPARFTKTRVIDRFYCFGCHSHGTLLDLLACLRFSLDRCTGDSFTTLSHDQQTEVMNVYRALYEYMPENPDQLMMVFE
jgi:hypothetical protein